jgi:hypothetical protein
VLRGVWSSGNAPSRTFVNKGMKMGRKVSDPARRDRSPAATLEGGPQRKVSNLRGPPGLVVRSLLPAAALAITSG